MGGSAPVDPRRRPPSAAIGRGLRVRPVPADITEVSGTGTLATIHRDLHLLRQDVQGSLLLFLAAAESVEACHRRFALVGSLVRHLTGPNPEDPEC